MLRNEEERSRYVSETWVTDILSVKSVSPVSLIASPPFNKIVPVRLEADGLLDVALTANISFSPVASVPETGVTPFHANQSPHSEANVAAQGNPFVALKATKNCQTVL